MIVKQVDNDIFKEPTDIICQQVNCHGKMGAGLALQIRKKYPEVYKKYYEMCQGYMAYEHKALLGKSLIVRVQEKPPLYIANLFGQFYYGVRETQTDREALKCAINDIVWKLQEVQKPITISVPYGMGCSLAGDNWEELQPIIVKAFGDAEAKCGINITLKICKFPTR